MTEGHYDFRTRFGNGNEVEAVLAGEFRKRFVKVKGPSGDGRLQLGEESLFVGARDFL